MKKFILQSLLLILALTFAQGALAYDFKSNGVYYNILSGEDNAVAVISNGSYSGIVEIPATVEYNGTTYSVKSIGYDAFYKCTALTSVTIPNSVTSIGVAAFYDCTGLTSITIPNSVTSIASSAFHGCNGLTSVTIPNSVTSIGVDAFAGCTGLASVTLPNNIALIRQSAFYDCSDLTSITIPNSVTSIGANAFAGCSGLKSVTIPNSVTSIDMDAFYKCSSLKSVTIGNSVTSIGVNAFYGCNALSEIRSNNATPPTTTSSSFENVKVDQCKLYVPTGSKDAYAKADVWAKFINIIEGDAKNPESDKQCAKPTISFVNGKIVFACETKDAKYNYSVKAKTSDSSDATHTTQIDLVPVTTYTVKCYASADGYTDSETATATITLQASDVNHDGVVDINDVNSVISTICGE